MYICEFIDGVYDSRSKLSAGSPSNASLSHDNIFDVYGQFIFIIYSFVIKILFDYHNPLRVV